MMEYDELDELDVLIEQLIEMARPEAVENAAGFGIAPQTKFYGVAVSALRKMGKKIGNDHELAGSLWESNIHDARILATIVDDPQDVTAAQMELWVSSIDSWDLCDQCCTNLFHKTEFAYEKALEWSDREEVFVKRAGIALMANLVTHQETISDDEILKFVPILERHVEDERESIKRAILWAMRQIGKRNRYLNSLMIETAKNIEKSASQSAFWIASEVLRELTKETVQQGLSG